MPSGAPTGGKLAEEISVEVRGRVISSDLQELSTILDRSVGREALVAAVRKRLKDLQPAGGMLALPEYPWHAIYTTNFDRLVEVAYRRVHKPLVVIRSDYDYPKLEQNEGTPLFKIHGCISEDVVDGSPSRLILTEEDYADYAKYRKIVFGRLGLDLMTKDVLVIGQSLRDPHLQQQMRQALEVKQESTGTGRLLALVYENDVDRAALWEARGFTLAFGDLDSFLHGLTVAQPPASTGEGYGDERLILKPLLRTAAIDVDHALRGTPDAVRMFNGRAATYADVAAGHAFRRSALAQVRTQLEEPGVLFLTIAGTAGVGKTSLARELLADGVSRGIYGWEHPRDIELLVAEWLEVDDQLRERDQHGLLLIDDFGPYLRRVNQLATQLSERPDPRLKLVLTITNAQWRPRQKAPALLTRGSLFPLSTLSSDDIASLVRLADENAEIKQLVEPGFAALSQTDKRRRLADRARADMYVCLKNVFANEALDDILLREYAELDESQQDIYRFVAALQAMGGHVHRQLVIRLLTIAASDIMALLHTLTGVVDEYTIDADEGLYGWTTRHEVIARTISGYKYSSQEELKELITQVVEELNPTVYVEIRAMRDMCNAEWGIASLPNPEDQLEIYQRMVEIAPRERIPRHRVIRKLLDMGRLDAAALAIRDAEDVAGTDRPIHRYKVRLAILRAETTQGILPQDRLAILRGAESTALRGLDRFADDRYSFAAYADVGVAIARQSGDTSVLEAALRLMTSAYDRILDPEMSRDIDQFERIHREFTPK